MEMNPSPFPSLGLTVISARCKIWCLFSLKHLLLYFILLQLRSVEKYYFKILFQRWGTTQYLNSLRKICENAYSSICPYPKEIKAESEKICSFKKKRLMKSIDEKRECQQATPYGVTPIPSIQAATEFSAWNTYLAAVSDHTELHLTVSCGTYMASVPAVMSHKRRTMNDSGHLLAELAHLCNLRWKIAAFQEQW